MNLSCKFREAIIVCSINAVMAMLFANISIAVIANVSRWFVYNTYITEKNTVCVQRFIIISDAVHCYLLVWAFVNRNEWASIECSGLLSVFIRITHNFSSRFDMTEFGLIKWYERTSTEVLSGFETTFCEVFKGLVQYMFLIRTW